MKDAANCDKYCELQSSVNQQISERIRHAHVTLRVYLSQGLKPNVFSFCWGCCASHLCEAVKVVLAGGSGRLNVLPEVSYQAWDQARLPAEFKHINKRSEKKQNWIPLVMANEQGRAQGGKLCLRILHCKLEAGYQMRLECKLLGLAYRRGWESRM